MLQYPAVNPAIDGKPYKYYYAGGYGESNFLQFGVSSGIKPIYAINVLRPRLDAITVRVR